MLTQRDLMAAWHAGGGKGSTLTQKHAQSIARRLDTYLRAQRITLTQVRQLKQRHLENFVRELGAVQSARTQANSLAALRRMLTGAGMSRTAENLTRERLGIADYSRAGTKRAIEPDRYAAALAAAQRRDEGLAVCLELARYLGLRQQEAVQAGPLLAKWARDLAAGRPLAVVDGTKGGRFRLVHPANVEALQGVVARALAVSRERGGVLIAKPELKKAVDYVDRHGRKAGLTGDQSFHSLRYAFASEQIAHYLAQGYTQKQAEAMTSADLGHGTQRTDFVRTVYSKK